MVQTIPFRLSLSRNLRLRLREWRGALSPNVHVFCILQCVYSLCTTNHQNSRRFCVIQNIIGFYTLEIVVLFLSEKKNQHKNGLVLSL